MKHKRISSVLELSRYKVGDIAYWVTLRYKQPLPELKEDEEWMYNIHPKTLYEHGPFKKYWPYRNKLPKLHHLDFAGLVAILTSEFVVEPFEIFDVIRSNETGEFYYANHDEEWMPEGYLFDTAPAARRELTRLVKMVNKWTQEHAVSS